MEFFIFVLIICLMIFLFVLFLLANDDFVLFRRDISMERVFDIALLIALASLLGARILHVVLNPSASFLNPLVFFGLPYFPGLSLTGGIIGGILTFFLFFARDSKIPVGRLLDLFSISFLAALPFGFLGFLLLSLGDKEVKHIHIIGQIVSYTILFIVIVKFGMSSFLSAKLKDGSIGLIFLASFCTISLIENAADRGGKSLFSADTEDFILFFILFISIIFLFRQEKMLSKIIKFKQKRG